MTQEEVLEELRQVPGDIQYTITATIIYQGDANWLGRTIEKSLRTPFVAVRGNSINTAYELKEE